ncbi:MAG: hypothetical protein AAFO07_26820 [Bacteroidota bacterium]
MNIEEFVEYGTEMESAFLKNDLVSAKKSAFQYLEMAQSFKDNWNYGNAIHKANIMLGKIALKENQIELAKQYLIKAGKTPGSPQLNSFGPNLSLAKELLEHGERKAVIEFIKQSKKYWKWFFSWQKTRKFIKAIV